MPRYSVGTRSTGTGSTTLPIGSLYGGLMAGGRIREIGVWNTTAVAVDVKLVRLTSLGTPGTALVETAHDETLGLPQCNGFDTHTVGPTLGGDLGYRAQLGAAIGSGVIWTFSNLVVDADPTRGIGLIVATGTGQLVDWAIIWDEGDPTEGMPATSGERDRVGLPIVGDTVSALHSIDQSLKRIMMMLTIALEITPGDIDELFTLNTFS